jgi:DNA ligase D-like protein (predicted ligase)
MAATLTQERFTGPDWTFERKLDGIRLLAFKHGSDVRLLSRNQLPLNASYPSVVTAIARLPVHDVILDGEALGVWGPSTTLRTGPSTTLRTGPSTTLRAGPSTASRVKDTYHVFDILWLDGRDVTSLPLESRRALLNDLPLRSPIERVPSLDEPAPWERACREGWEGVIAKRRDSPYEHRRSPHWLKMKCEATQEFVVGGFTDPQRSRVGLGALLVGYFEGHDLVFAGKVGTGFDTKLLLDLRRRLDQLEVSTPTFTKAIGLPRKGAHWVRPEIVVQVAFIEWTVHGKLRHPRLLGVRVDKSPAEVTRETPVPVASVARLSRTTAPDETR